jgi:protein required for attachment to host cells
MAQVKIPEKAWLVVCDAVKALVLRNDGEGGKLALTQVDMAFHPVPFSHELGTEGPGRVFKSGGGGRSAVDITDLHLEEETAFLIQLAEQLDKAVAEHKVGNIVLVAPPKALGILRQHLAEPTRKLISAELDKDLARLPLPEIERHLAA